jgi:hypothetical protein
MKAAESYWGEMTGRICHYIPGTAWIRLSTGKLCLDVGDGVKLCFAIRKDLIQYTATELPSFKLTENDLHAKLLSALKLDEFHAMVVFCTQEYFLHDLPSSTEAITVPSIWIPSHYVDFKSLQIFTIPFPNHLTSNEIHMGSWNSYPLHSEVMPTGWTRWAE